jgi:predicted alpha/beta hydrolase family esterase
VIGEREKEAIEGALINAELFLKYRMPDRAIATLREALNHFPDNTDVRWQLIDIYIDHNQRQEAGEELVTLANIFVKKDQKDFCRLALLKLKEIYPSSKQVDSWLTSLDQQQRQQKRPETISGPKVSPNSVLVGDLGCISLFDVIQAVEKNKITGIVHVDGQEVKGQIYFNQGLVADVITSQLRGKPAFKQFAEVTDGFFYLDLSPIEFHSSIVTSSNAQLILEIFADIETEEPAEN